MWRQGTAARGFVDLVNRSQRARAACPGTGLEVRAVLTAGALLAAGLLGACEDRRQPADPRAAKRARSRQSARRAATARHGAPARRAVNDSRASDSRAANDSRAAVAARRDTPPRRANAARRATIARRTAAAQRRAPARPAAPRTRFAPCGEAPQGMACVPGGPFWRGSDRHGRNARPRQRVVVSTFYLDVHEVTTPAFVACVKAGLCDKPPAYLRYRGFHGARQPAVPVSWHNALRICLMQGKRLPTEAEWEKAARTPDGRTYPWGEAAPNCRRAWFRGCKPATTRPVGSLPPNPYRIHDLAGNGYEWVMDWYSPCWAGCPGACGQACAGPDPRGPCGGKLRCEGHRRRVLRGGSWYWSAAHLRTFWRRPEHPNSGNHRLSARCATRSHHPRPRSPAEVRRLLQRLERHPLPR